jgi:hypothetical protein
MLAGQPAKIQLVVNTSSSSGAIAEELKQDSRIVITATRNGSERLATRFGAYFTEAFVDTAADTNKNNAVSVQEAFDYAERQVKDYFEQAGQLATEHPLIAGGQAAQFVLAKAVPATSRGSDPALTALATQRDEIDAKIQELQLRKGDLTPDDYLNQLQLLMIELSVVQDQIDRQNADGGQDGR